MDEHQPTLSNESTSPNLVAGTTKVLSLNYNTAGLLIYCPFFALNVIASIVFLASESPDSKFVRFHAMQSLILFSSVVVLGILSTIASIILGFVPMIGWLISMISVLGIWAYAIAAFFVSLYMMFQANKNEMTKLPVIGTYADRYSSQ